jgi:uncharacterized membrane protein YbhN (UPF0104 family)
MTTPSTPEDLADAAKEAPGRSRRAWAAALARLWPAVRVAVAVAVVAAVGWQFAADLSSPDLWSRPLLSQPGWLAASAALYLAGLGFWALYWFGLLRALGQRPRLVAALRAFYVGQVGRYVPGKVVGLGMRARLLAGPGVGMGVAVLTIVYETLTTLASGVLIGLVWFAFGAPGEADWYWRAAALLPVLVGLLLPAVFNRLAKWTVRPFRSADAPPLPQVRPATLLGGLAITACGWLIQGGALWAVVQAVAPDAWPASADAWCRCAAYVGLGYAAGFLVFVAPGGLGVREYLIQVFLAADLSRTLGPGRAAAVAVVAVLLLRLLWTALDAAAAAACYGLPGQTAADGERRAA